MIYLKTIYLKDNTVKIKHKEKKPAIAGFFSLCWDTNYKNLERILIMKEKNYWNTSDVKSGYLKWDNSGWKTNGYSDDWNYF